MTKTALCIGVSNYQDTKTKNLPACINDANSVANILKKNYDNTPNFEITTFITNDNTTKIAIEEEIEKLFNSESDSVLLYFSGHGYIDDELDGYLCSNDFNINYCVGVSMKNIIELANKSNIKDINIVLDCCHAGNMGDYQGIANIKKGISILASSRDTESSMATEEISLFTNLFVNALDGFASDILGNTSMAYIYAFIDKSLLNMQQRPIFKTHTSRFIPLRISEPKIEKNTFKFLQRIDELFITKDIKFKLDNTFEPDKEAVKRELNIENPTINKAHEKTFGFLQELVKVNIIKPSNYKHMYYEAIKHGACELTKHGKIYWQLAKDNKI